MSASERRKGADFEREIANDLTEDWGVRIRRNIGQSRDGGDDITVPPFRFECKRRATISIYKWLKQVEAASAQGEVPVVVARADGERPIVVLRYSDFKKLAREELG